jgi:hypothetical protein
MRPERAQDERSTGPKRLDDPPILSSVQVAEETVAMGPRELTDLMADLSLSLYIYI